MSATDVVNVESPAIKTLAAKGNAEVTTYSVTVNNFQPNSGIETLLMLGLSHKDIQSTYKRTRWIYQQNPSGAAVVCTVKHSASDENMGLLSLCRRQIWTSRGLVQAAILCDLVTDKSHRTLGPAILLIQEALVAAKQLGLDRVYGWPNERSIVLFKRLSTAQRSDVDIYRRYFDWSTILAGKIPRLPAKLIGGVVKCADALCAAIVQRICDRHFVIKHLDSFGPEFDEVWIESRERYDEIGVRDATFLNWRFGHNSDSEHKIFCLYARKTKKPAGYIVYKELTEESVEISDFLAIDGRFTERTLLWVFCNHTRRSGTDKVSLVFAGNKNTRKNLWLSGFISVDSRAAISFPIAAATMQKVDVNTHITQADHDVG